MTRLRTAVALVAVLVCSPMTARADIVLDWNKIAVDTFIANGQNPFSQARFMAITQLAVFEAVNVITKKYEPYLGTGGVSTVVAPAGASADAAAIAAAYNVLKAYFPSSALDVAYTTSLAALPDAGKIGGIATGVAAAEQMIARRVGDGSADPEFYFPESSDPGVWQLTPSCPAAGGTNFHWKNVTPFGVPTVLRNKSWIERFLPGPPPALKGNKYARDYNEVMTVGSVNSDLTERPQDRADVARFYAASSPSFVFNAVARQVAAAQGKSLSHNARALALLNMASSDSLVASFATKYHYNLWRPETAIRAGDTDDNEKTDQDLDFKPYITTPCFPSYPSNHAAGSNSAAEILRRLYGADGHSITLANLVPVPGVTLNYTKFKHITDDIDDARVYGGIHFRFEQEVGASLGRDVAQYIYNHNFARHFE